jgi:Mg2+ and Co2+ transporter CorA
METNGQKNTVNTNIFTREFGFSPVNPFNAKIDNKTIFNQNPQKRLNGYDSTILNSSKFDQAEEQELSIDYRIKEKENAIKDLDEKIKLADNYGTQNEALGLKAKRQRYLQELSSLEKQRMYGGRVLGDKEKILHNTLKEKLPFIYKFQTFISRKILAKISKKVNSVVTLSDSLEQLSQISKSVDELMDMNIPYGEKSKNYDKLTQYLSKANVIHSKISKSLRY